MSSKEILVRTCGILWRKQNTGGRKPRVSNCSQCCWRKRFFVICEMAVLDQEPFVFQAYSLTYIRGITVRLLDICFLKWRQAPCCRLNVILMILQD